MVFSSFHCIHYSLDEIKGPISTDYDVNGKMILVKKIRWSVYSIDNNNNISFRFWSKELLGFQIEKLFSKAK